MSRRTAAFTLLEVLAVVVLTALVMGVALRFYVELSRASTRAAEGTRDLRHATAVLDRVARDFERVVLVTKPDDDSDPLEHPWLFFGEARGGGTGADHVKFMTRGHVPRRTAGRESDLEVVAYAVRQSEDEESIELMRWSSPRLPERHDPEIPDDEERGAVLLADGLAAFGVTFIDELGERSSSWDSSTVVRSGQLPVAVEIEVALANRDDPEADPTTLQRRVLLPLRPIDLTELLDPNSAVGGGDTDEEGEGDEEEEEGEDDAAACSTGPCAGLTVCQAVNCSVDLGPSFTELMSQIGGDSFCRWRSRIPQTLRSAIRNPACR